jgi:hypothetical protein
MSTLAAPPLSSAEPARAQNRGIKVTVIMIAVAIHALALFLAGIYIAVRYFAEPKATFEVVKEFKIPVQTREHKMNMARHEAMAPKPTFNDRLVSTRPTKFSLPEMPKIDMDQMLPLDPSELVSDQVSGLVGSGGMGSGVGSGGLGSGGTGMTGTSFFGIKTEGRRFLLVFDVSGSVVNKATASGFPLSEIKKETINLLAKLPLNARYSIVQFVRNFKPFTAELVPATPPNREAATKWIETEWSESGQMAAGGNGVRSASPNGLPIVLDFAFSLKPDTIFLISDGSFEQTTPAAANRSIPTEELEAQIKKLQLTAGKEVPIHFIGFQMKEEAKDFWRKTAQRSGGKFREIGR